MSMYNLIHGVNPNYKEILSLLGTSVDGIPRFRDCYLVEDGGMHVIAIYTRTGGGNRPYHESAESYKEETGEDREGPWNSDLRKLPGFIRDEDDDFDCTYATFYYKLPDDFAARLARLERKDGE